MAKVRVVGVREETPDEAALRRWFARQALASPDSLEAAARLLIGLVTGLLTVLFGVLAVAGDPRPAYLGAWGLRLLGVACVGVLLVALLAALYVVLPQRLETDAARPDTQVQTFEAQLRRKAGWLRAATIAFGLGVGFLGAALIVALLAA